MNLVAHKMSSEKLLTRDEFRNSVFERDKHKCVFCEEPAVDAHHILERRLWPDGGYYLSNGASVCAKHHILCETTEISVDDVRRAVGITKPIIPPHLYDDQEYDKWGNIIMANGTRLKGELFEDESVQKILNKGNKLDLFSSLVKYPRTYHLPWSPGLHDDDRMMESLSAFENTEVIVTEKMDGENTSMYRNGFHARSVDGRHHPSRDWVKQFWGNIASDIPEGWRICGENLYAEHSISYKNLPTYFMGFSIWNERNVCLSWDETLDYFSLLGITPVPVIYRGPFDLNRIRSLAEARTDWNDTEGYVVRVSGEIAFSEFKTKVGKFVRKDHVRTTRHWMFGQQIIKNGIANES